MEGGILPSCLPAEPSAEQGRATCDVGREHGTEQPLTHAQREGNRRFGGIFSEVMSQTCTDDEASGWDKGFELKIEKLVLEAEGTW